MLLGSASNGVKPSWLLSFLAKPAPVPGAVVGYDFVTGGDELVKFWFVKGRNIACEIGVVPKDEVM